MYFNCFFWNLVGWILRFQWDFQRFLVFICERFLLGEVNFGFTVGFSDEGFQFAFLADFLRFLTCPILAILVFWIFLRFP